MKTAKSSQDENVNKGLVYVKFTVSPLQSLNPTSLCIQA